MTNVSLQDAVGRIQRKETQNAQDLMDDGAGQQLGAVSLRVAGELAEKLQVDAVVIMTTRPEIEMNRAANNRFGKLAAGQGREFAIQNVRIQMVNQDGMYPFAEAIRKVNPEALSKKTFALNYDADQIMARYGESLDEAVDKEVGHLSGKVDEEPEAKGKKKKK